jgi:hypothetical protein
MLPLLLAPLLLTGPQTPQSRALPASVVPAHQSVPLPRPALVGCLPRATTSAGAAFHRGSAYVLGGYAGRPHDYVIEDQAADFLRLDLGTGRSELLPNLGPIQGLALVAVDEALVQVGGLRIRNGRGEAQRLESVTEVHRFDPLHGSWTPLPDLPAPRSSHDAIAVDSALYVVGGWNLSAGDVEGSYHDTVLRLDLAAEEPAWSAIEQPFRARALAVASHGAHLVVIGGMDDLGGVVDAVHLFDTASGQWSQGPSFPDFGFGVAAVSTPQGVVATGRSGKLWRFAPGEERWTALGQLWFPRLFPRLVGDGAGGVVVLGGIGDGSRPVAVEHLGADLAGATQLAISVPSPMAANNRQALLRRGSTLFFAGGNNGTEQHDFAPERFETSAFGFDLLELRFQRRAPLPAPRQSGQLLTLDRDRLLFVGGFAHDGDEARTQDDLWTYHWREDRWVADGATLPTPRTQFGLGEVGGTHWLLGGLAFDPDLFEAFAYPPPVLRFAAEGETPAFASTELELPEQRRSFACAAFGEHLVVVGGMGQEFAPVESCWRLDPLAGTFEPIAAPAGVRIGADLVPIGEHLVLVGGTYLGGAGRAQAIEVYDPAADRWTVSAATLPFGAGHVHALEHQGALLALSTQEHPGRLELLWIDPFAGARAEPVEASVR